MFEEFSKNNQHIFKASFNIYRNENEYVPA